jgi:hypothetical protein
VLHDEPGFSEIFISHLLARTIRVDACSVASRRRGLFRIGFEFWLVDEGLESSLPDEAVLATRLYTLEGFAMTAGADAKCPDDKSDALNNQQDAEYQRNRQCVRGLPNPSNGISGWLPN